MWTTLKAQTRDQLDTNCLVESSVRVAESSFGVVDARLELALLFLLTVEHREDVGSFIKLVLDRLVVWLADPLDGLSVVLSELIKRFLVLGSCLRHIAKVKEGGRVGVVCRLSVPKVVEVCDKFALYGCHLLCCVLL